MQRDKRREGKNHPFLIFVIDEVSARRRNQNGEKKGDVRRGRGIGISISSIGVLRVTKIFIFFPFALFKLKKLINRVQFRQRL